MAMKAKMPEITPPPANADERELAQWLFERSLFCDVRKLPAIKALAKERPEVLAAAAIFLLTQWKLLEFPRDAAVADAKRAGVSLGRDEHSGHITVTRQRDRFISQFHRRTHSAASDAAAEIMRLKFPWQICRVEALMKWAAKAAFDPADQDVTPYVTVAAIACESTSDRATPEMVGGLRRLKRWLTSRHAGKRQRRAIEQIEAMLGEAPEWPIDPRDPWAAAAIEEMEAMPAERQAAWTALLNHAAQGTGDTPAKKWIKEANPLLDAVGRDAFADAAARWLPMLAQSRANGKPSRIAVKSAEGLRGLAWFCGMIAQGDALPPALQALAEAAHAKVPGQGRRCVQVGNGAIWALMQWPAEVTAGRLRAVIDNVRNRQTTAYIEPRLDQIAEKAGTTRDALEEAALPDLGLIAGRKSVPLGECAVELLAGDGSAANVLLRFHNDKGRLVKSAPAAVKRDHGEALKRLKAEAKDASRLLAAVRRRLEAAPLDCRDWSLRDFRKRYLDHGLAGTIARKLLWVADGIPVLFDGDGVAHDVGGNLVELGDTTDIRPWHPIDRPAEEVMAWRDRLLTLGVTQPFKQAHREVYVLTDAERNTATYSNRFAAHLIRQTQFRALAEQRGWKSDYLGLWDTGGADHPHVELSAWGLRAEWWTDVAQVTDDVNTTSYGGAVYFATDQVRFYEGSERDPLPLERVPPLAFSEVMRDVDLFVGVASVGNDPAWQDGGPEGRYYDYWHGYSFGDLGQTAQTRKAVLEALVPRLKIAGRCSFTDKFLVVRGRLRTYKIHLGSGNILMEPNDEYLCIVPDRRSDGGKGGGGEVFLPFEGDRTLSIILSKALLLAEDTTIKDSTILSQIRPK